MVERKKEKKEKKDEKETEEEPMSGQEEETEETAAAEQEENEGEGEDEGESEDKAAKATAKKEKKSKSKKRKRKSAETDDAEQGEKNDEEEGGEGDGDDEASKVSRKAKKRKPYFNDNPSTQEMILESLQGSLMLKKGMTVAQIRTYLYTEYQVKPTNLKTLMRNALNKLLDQGSIMTPKGLEVKSVLLGRYKLAPKPKVTDPEEKKEAARPLRSNIAIAKALKKKKAKRRRRY